MATANRRSNQLPYTLRTNQRKHFSMPIFSVVVIVCAGLIASSCTSTSSPNLSASSTHSRLATTPTSPAPIGDPIAQQINAGQQSATRSLAVQNPDSAPENSIASQINQSTANPIDQPVATQPSQIAGVIYQDTRQAPSQPQPTTQLASLNSSNYATAGDDRLVYEEPETPETLAQKRVDTLFSSMKHATCKGGWATPPSKLDAKRETIGDPYYVEMRLRNTPLLPVGHTYIAYGRLSPEGQPIDEQVVMLSPIGGYGGAAFAAALPMPGILVPVADDCRIKPHAAYRVTLDAQKFEKLLIRIQKAQKKIPAYALFAYNCNHFASDIVAPVGILPPKNIYVPALKYIYAVIEANEGFNPKRRRG